METETVQVRSGGTKRLVAIFVAVFLLLAGAVGVYVAKPFTSPKQLLLSQLPKAKLPDKGVLSATYAIELSDLTGQPAEFSWLDGSRFELGAELDLAQRQLAVKAQGPYEAQTWQANLFADQKLVIFDVGGLLPVVESALGFELPLPAQYVTLSDDDLDGVLTEFWAAYDAARAAAAKSSPTKEETAILKLAELFFNAIPDQYYERVGMAGVRLSFDQKGLQEILKAIVTDIYENQEAWIATFKEVAVILDDSVLESELAELEADFLSTLEEAPLAEVLNEIDEEFADAPLVLGEVSLTFNRDFDIDAATTLYIDDPDTSMGGTVKLSYTIKHDEGAQLAFPQLDESNSIPLEELFMELGLIGPGFGF